MSGPSKPFANQQERKAFFTRSREQKQFPHYDMGTPNPSYYAQQPFQPVFFMSNYGPPSQYAFVPGNSPWMGTPYGFNYAQQPQPVFYAPGYGPPSQSQIQMNVNFQSHPQSAASHDQGGPDMSQPSPTFQHPQSQFRISLSFPSHPGYVGSQNQAGPDMPQHCPMFQHLHSQFQDPSTLHHGRAYQSGLFKTDAVVCEVTEDSSPSTSSTTGSSTANSSLTPSSSVSVFTKGQHTSKASELKRKVSTETMDASKKPKLQQDSTLEMSNHLKTPAQHTPKHMPSSALVTTSISSATPNTHDVQSRHQRCALNDQSESQSPAGKAAEPGKGTDAVQSKHQSIVVDSASEAQAVADRAAELQKNAHAIQANHQQFVAGGGKMASPTVRATYASCLATLAQTSSSILDMLQALRADETVPTIDPEAEENTIIDDASETQCLAGNAADSQQYSHAMHSRPQSPIVNDTSQSQSAEKSAAEPPKNSNTPTPLKTRRPKKRTPRMLQELASTLKTANEVLKRRTQPKDYANCFLPGIEDEDQESSNTSSSYEDSGSLNDFTSNEGEFEIEG